MSQHHDLGDFDFFWPNDLLYRYVRDAQVSHGMPTTACCPLKDWDVGLSCDWSLLRRPEETARALPGYVLRISVRDCRKLGIEIRYSPVVDPESRDYNLAHCLLFLPDNLKTRAEKVVLRAAYLRKCTLERVECPRRGD